MGGQRGAGDADSSGEGRRRAALTAFLGAGMASPPSEALLVAALAGARRVVAVHQARGLAVDEGLAGEAPLAGTTEAAARVGAPERPGGGEETAPAYPQGHPTPPDRATTDEAPATA